MQIFHNADFSNVFLSDTDDTSYCDILNRSELRGRSLILDNSLNCKSSYEAFSRVPLKLINYDDLKPHIILKLQQIINDGDLELNFDIRYYNYVILLLKECNIIYSIHKTSNHILLSKNHLINLLNVKSIVYKCKNLYAIDDIEINCDFDLFEHYISLFSTQNLI